MNRLEKIAGKMVADAPFSVDVTAVDAINIQMFVRHVVVAGNALVPVSKFFQAERALESYCNDVIRNMAKVIPTNPNKSSVGMVLAQMISNHVEVNAVVTARWMDDAVVPDFETAENALARLGYR